MLTKEQRKARNEAFQLITIAHRILKDAGLVEYASDAEMIATGMRLDAQMLEQQERNRRLGS